MSMVGRVGLNEGARLFDLGCMSVCRSLSMALTRFHVDERGEAARRSPLTDDKKVDG